MNAHEWHSNHSPNSRRSERIVFAVGLLLLAVLGTRPSISISDISGRYRSILGKGDRAFPAESIPLG